MTFWPLLNWQEQNSLQASNTELMYGFWLVCCTLLLWWNTVNDFHLLKKLYPFLQIQRSSRCLLLFQPYLASEMEKRSSRTMELNEDMGLNTTQVTEHKMRVCKLIHGAVPTVQRQSIQYRQYKKDTGQ